MDLQYKPISSNYIAQQGIELKQRLPKIPQTRNYRKWTNTRFLAQNRDSTTKTKTSRTVAQSPGFEDQKETFRIILVNRNTCFYQMTQTVDVHRSKSSFASSFAFVSESATHNSLSLTCAHDILLVTIITMPISKSSLLSCTLVLGSCEEKCKPLLYQFRPIRTVINKVK